MKSINIIKKAAVLLTFTLSLSTLFAQNDTMYIMKNGVEIARYNVNTEVDSIIFYKPSIVEGGLKVQTDFPESRTETAIVLSGTIISNTAGGIIEKGFVYATDHEPTFEDLKIVSETEKDTFFATLSGISIEKDFYIRAYAINATDTVYGASINTGPVALKPNIYIYPTKKMKLSVNLSFPLGGNIVTSIPDYNTGWDLTVEPSGAIDNEYTYLFYESSQPAVWQTETGWQVKQDELTQFFTSNMTSYGFSEQEILDFIDFWIPRFVDKAYYTIYPQTNVQIDQAISINYSTSPDKIMRLFYLVKGFDNEPVIELEKPIIPTFERTGFYVTEWGVLL